MQHFLTVGFVLASGLTALPAAAQTRSQVYGGALTQQAQTVYVRGEVGMTTYESEAAESKETQTSQTAILGGWAGEDRIIGAQIVSSEADVPFELNDTNMRTAFRDVKIMGRLGWLVPSLGVSLTEVNISQDDVESVAIYSTGASAGLAIQIPVAPFLVVEAGGQAVKSTKVYDKLDQDTKLGQRTEANLEADFDVTDRLVDLIVGYRVRQYDLQIGEETAKEKSQGAYAGIRLGLYF
jgi:hypothetical protein